MDKVEVLENLCNYDKRNPYFDKEFDEVKTTPCYCDNCFYGRDKLARELLKLY